MFLLEHLQSGYRALHTGDCRAAPAVVDAALYALRRRAAALPGTAGKEKPLPSEEQPPPTALHCLYLDTTYASPRWTFPPQPQALESIAALVNHEAFHLGMGGVVHLLF